MSAPEPTTPTPEEIRSALQDARRIDWLADQDNHLGAVQLPTECVLANIDSLRGAIDAAMRLQARLAAEQIMTGEGRCG